MKVLLICALISPLLGACALFKPDGPPVPAGSRLFLPVEYAGPTWSLLPGDSSKGVQSDVLLTPKEGM